MAFYVQNFLSHVVISTIFMTAACFTTAIVHQLTSFLLRLCKQDSPSNFSYAEKCNFSGTYAGVDDFAGGFPERLLSAVVNVITRCKTLLPFDAFTTLLLPGVGAVTVCGSGGASKSA